MAKQVDFFSVFVDQLADALAIRLNRVPQSPGVGRTAKALGVKRRKGEKRSAALIAKTTSGLLAHIKAHHGQRIEQIAAAMGTSTADLKLPTQKLLAQKKIKAQGQRRGTKYSAA